MASTDEDISQVRRLEVVSVFAWVLGSAAWLLDISSGVLVDVIGILAVVALFGVSWGGCIVFSTLSIVFGIRMPNRKLLERGCIGLLLAILLMASIHEARQNRDQIDRQWEEHVEQLQE